MNDNLKKVKDAKGVEIFEFLNNFLTDSHSECFKYCFKDFNSSEILNTENDCFDACLSKYFLSYSNISENLI